MEKDINISINILTKYLIENDWKVVYNKKDKNNSTCDPSTYVITITETKPLNILYTLLHETGHTFLFELDDYDESFNEIVRQCNWSITRQTKKYHYQKLKEELLAWEYGLNIAKKLNIFIDESDYDSYAAKYFMSYVYNSSQHFYQTKVKNICEKTGIDITFE